MSFRRLLSLAVGLALACAVHSASAQGVPNGITYQGMLLQNGVPYNCVVQLDFIFADSAGTTSIFSITRPGVQVTNGIFNVVLGPFPKTMTFDEQYSFSITATIGASSVPLPPQLLWSAPYAFNANRVNGMLASPIPVNGQLFPVPLNAQGKIDTSILPSMPTQSSAIETINNLSPDQNNNFQINGGSGVSISMGAHSVTISDSSQSLITSVLGTNGIIGGGSSGNLVLGIGTGAITSNMLSPRLAIGKNSDTRASLTVSDSEANGNAALVVQGGIGANNSTGAADGTGLSAGSPQTFWADQVSVPSGTGTSIQIYNTLVNAASTIMVTAVGSSAASGGVTVTAQAAGTFTVSSKNAMASSGGTVTALNYMIVNH